MTERKRLPLRRMVQTFELHHKTETTDQVYQVSIGYFDDMTPAEVFITGAKVGSSIEAVARDAAILLSLAMQFGVPVDTLKNSITRDSFNNPSSIIGAIIDKLSAEKQNNCVP